MEYAKQLKAIRKEEGVNRQQFCDEVGIPVRTMEKYEQGKAEPGGSALKLITNHPRYEKYTLWLMTGKTAPEYGQICPVFSTQDTEGGSAAVQKEA